MTRKGLPGANTLAYLATASSEANKTYVQKVFFPFSLQFGGKPFQPSLLFVSKAAVYPLIGALKGVLLG